MRNDSIRQRLNKLIIVMSCLALFLFLIVIAIVFIFKNNRFDTALFSFASQHTSTASTRIMLVISFLGSHEFLIPANLLLLVIFIVLKERWWAIRVAVISLSSFILIRVLKHLFQRHRPDLPMIDGYTNYGFPSGHGMLAVIFYGLVAGWIAVSVKNKWYRSTTISFLILLVLVIGYSRIYLRLHYATDVLAGFCVGTLWLAFCLWTVKQFSNRGSGLVRNL